MKAKDYSSAGTKCYKFAEKVGPGGHKCPCCGDVHIKRRNNRKHRHQSKQALKKEEVGQ